MISFPQSQPAHKVDKVQNAWFGRGNVVTTPSNLILDDDDVMNNSSSSLRVPENNVKPPVSGGLSGQ